jgi:ketohexokinase
MAESPSDLQVPLNLVAILPARSSVAAQQIRSAFEPHVSLEHCIYREEFEEPASSYIIKSQASGSRTIVNYNELPEMTLEEFKSIVDGLRNPVGWFHLEVCLSLPCY